MKSKSRIFLLILTAVLCLIMGYQTAYGTEDDKDVENNAFVVDVEVGIDGVAVEYRSTPVTVKVRNLGDDFEGTLRVIIPATYSQKSLAYEKTVTVPSGGEKSFSILLPDIQNTSFLRIELENTRGKILLSKRQSYTSKVQGQEAVVGVLSSDYTGLNYFDGTTINTNNYGVFSAKLLQLTADNIPEVGAGLDTCDYILIDNYNTSQLSDEQIQAIVSWVNNGGILIFGTGSKASVVLEGFQNTLAPAVIGNLSKGSLSVYSYDSYSVDRVDIADISMNNWMDIQGLIAPGAPAWQSIYGGGTVTILSYDLAMNPIANWKEGRGQLAVNILSNTATVDQFSRISGNVTDKFDQYEIEGVVSHVDRNKIPNSLLYGAIFLVYVVAIGPAAYLVLRAMDKREKLWIVMPGVAFGFTMIILLTSMMYKIHKPFVDDFSIVEFSNGLRSTTSYMSIQSPKGKEYDVDLNPAYQEVATWNQDVDYSQIAGTDYEYAIRDRGDHLMLHMAQNMAFTRQNLSAEKHEYSENRGLVTNFSCSVSGVEGELYNETGYDLKNVVVCYYDKYVFVGDMKNGDKFVVKPGSSYDITAVGSWDMSAWMDKTPNDYGELQRFFGTSDEYAALTENQLVYRMLRGKAGELELYQGMIFGMIDDYDPEITDDNKVKMYSAGLAVSYFQQIPEEYQQYSVFIDDINDYMVGGDKVAYTDDYPDGYSYFYDVEDRDMFGEPVLEVLYDFSSLNMRGAMLLNNDVAAGSASNTDYDPDIMDLDDYYNYIAEYESDYRSYASVELYNTHTGQYDKVFENGEASVTDLTPYVDANGWMLIRYTDDPQNSNGYYECYGPHISLIGGEQ